MLPCAALAIGGTRNADMAATMPAKPTAPRNNAGPAPTLAISAPATSGPHHARALPHDGVERDGVHQVLARDEVRVERLPGRVIECLRARDEEGQDEQVPQVCHVQTHQRSHYNQQHTYGDGHHHDENALVQPVGDDAAVEVEYDSGHCRHAAEICQRLWVASDVPDEPTLDDKKHLEAGDGEEQSREVEAVVTVLQCGGNDCETLFEGRLLLGRGLDVHGVVSRKRPVGVGRLGRRVRPSLGVPSVDAMITFG